MATKLTSLLLLPTFMFVSACAPDKNAVSDEERQNIFCSTKKNDREEICQSDEVMMDYRQVSVILTQKVNRELSLQSALLKQNLLQSLQTANSLEAKSEKIIGKNALNLKLQIVNQTNAQGLQIPASLTAQTLVKDLGVADSTVQTLNFAEIFSALNNNSTQLMNLSRKESKEQAASLGNFVIVNEKINYSVSAENLVQTTSEVTWSGETQAVFSKFNKNGKHFFSKDIISEKGKLKLSQNPDGTQSIETLSFDWNIAPRKDAILNHSVSISGPGHQLVEVEPGCFRFVGEFIIASTGDGVKKKPLRNFTSKVVVTALEMNVFNGNADGTFKSNSAKTEVIPGCSEYDGLSVNYGLVL